MKHEETAAVAAEAAEDGSTTAEADQTEAGGGGAKLAQREKMVTRPMRSERSKQFDWDVIEVFFYTCFGTAASATPLTVFFPQKEVFVEEIEFFSSAKIFLYLFRSRVEHFLS